uniref:Meiosis regulator and mRNA stability factor 1 n=1 Tax=Nothobranchius furzeri TaxID=105023 RepID=A0A8C6LG29_NOTFU
MENKNPVLELKDVPPPPHHTPPSQLPKSLSFAPLSFPPPCLLPPPPPLVHDSHQQQPKYQEGASPKVSICTHCDCCTSDGSLGRKVGGDCSSIAGTGVHHLSPSSCGAPISSSNSSRLVTCSVASSVHQYKQSCGGKPEMSDSFLRLGFKSQLPCSVATSQPLSLHPYFPCCSGPHNYSAVPFSCTQSSAFPSSAPLASSTSSLASLRGSCLAPSGCNPCGVNSSARASHRAILDHPSTTTITTSTTSAHFCSNSLHLNVERTVCGNGAHFCCQECFLQISPTSESEKAWPKVPAPHAASVPVPICNGCGTSSDAMVLKPSTTFGKTTQKYGSPENGVPENIPPVGVFWDIENCSVPSGRSAEAVVQRIRSRFFQGHREAEFICVCDISKESRVVIQELNNCQVTVAHINATAKNAADDKLRQSLRRFAETHAAPATVVLVSSDVNFASELSDLRHRHGFQIVLVHGNHASSALLQHAHRHVAFQEITADLPQRVLVKAQPSFNLLYVHNLPIICDKSLRNAVKLRLRRLSDNCGGKVLGMSQGTAVLRFGSAEAAARARKRMENEDVFGHRISLSFHPRPRDEAGPEAELQSQPPLLPRPPIFQTQDTIFELVNMEGKSRMGLHPLDKGDSSTSPRKNDEKAGSVSRSVTESPVDQRERNSGEFQISTPSAFSKLNLHRSFSPLVVSPGSWSSRSGSPCLSSRSSPLLATPRSSRPEGPPDPFSEGAEVQVANLDYRMSRKELQQTLHDTFCRYGQVKAVELSPHTDYQLKATVQMSLLQQAIGAVSGLHRYKIGGKRIQVSLVTGGSSKPLTTLRCRIVGLNFTSCLPLFKLAEIYEKKYSRKLAIGDLYRLPDVLSVREQGGSRLVCLLPNSQIRQSPLGSSQSQEGSSSASGSPVVFEELEYHEPVCRQHYAHQDFSEADFDPDSYKVPFVVTSLSSLASAVHSLLESHGGTLPLLSFVDCYAEKFSPLQFGSETLEGGVPLEHLITCVPSVTLVTAQNGFKVIKWTHNKPPAQNSESWIQRCRSPVGNPQLIQFSREIIDLLKNQPSCVMPISKFIPSYHHHFAKQCRVSDYGFSKLLELLEAVPHVLQILGMGTKRLLTLTHRAQVKRFTQDLLKLLKFQASKQVAIKDFTQAYHWCFSRDWRVTDYGVCDLMDLLTEIPDTTITIAQQETDAVISVPKRDRTVEEMERTKQFGKEVVDLLRHQPRFRMSFSKFIPTYHHHLGRQCKLSYYGFTKLLELFEAIPDIVTVLECSEDKVLILTEVERIKALAAQLVKLLRTQNHFSLPVSQLLTEYSKTFGYGLRLQDYDATSLPALLAKLCHVVKVVDGSEGREVQLINRKSLRLLTSQLLALLMSQDDGQVTRGMKVEELSRLYLSVHGTQLNPCEYGFLSLSELLKSLPYLVEDEWVRLARLYQFARNVRALLHTYHYNQIFLTEFQGAYNKFTGCSLEPRSYGYFSADELLGAIPQVVWIKGHGHKRIIVLKNDMKAAESELLCLTSPLDLLCGPVPSCLPSPQLHPDPIGPQQVDLINFEKTQLLTGQFNVAGLTPKCESEEAAADDPSDPPEHPGATPPPDLRNSLSLSSPGRRDSRSRIKLAANFSFTVGL